MSTQPENGRGEAATEQKDAPAPQEGGLLPQDAPAPVKGVDFHYEANRVTAMIGPSGCGKSTLVRCINRMHEEIPGARAEGKITLDDLDLYGSSVDVVSVRRSIGMVFQKPNPFPTMSIFDNVAAGLRLTGRRGEVKDKVEKSLRGAG